MMHRPQPPQFLVNYPTGKIDIMGHNLRRLSRDASECVPPIRVTVAKGTTAIIIATNRPFSRTREQIRQHMQRAEDYGLHIVILCSGACRRQDVAACAETYRKLNWMVIEGPFTHAGLGLEFATDNALFSYPVANDTAPKRNFALLFARYMGWQTVLFVDDDITFSTQHFLKMIDAIYDGASIVASNARKYADNSVVVRALHDMYGRNQVDEFLGASAIAINAQDDLLGFCPHIYNEEWLFMLPYVLAGQKPVWAGSVKQLRYKGFTRQRAKNEEAGDLIGEGLVRLAMSILEQDSGGTPAKMTLQQLAQRADKTFWEREILQRAMFTQEMLGRAKRPSIRFLQRRRIRKALQTSLDTLIGNKSHDGITPEAAAAWVQHWIEDLARWHNVAKAHSPGARPNMDDVLERLGASARAVYRTPWPDAELAVSPEDNFGASLAALPAATRSKSQKIDLESTYRLDEYLTNNKLSLRDIVTMTRRLRYDRPIRSLSGNKPMATIVLLVRACEDPRIITEHVKELATWNTHDLPIHCIIWITPGFHKHRQRRAAVYREYLMTRLMFATAGTNIRLLSCLGTTQPDGQFANLMRELVEVTAFAYWKVAVTPVNHPTFVANSKNELLAKGKLTDLMRGQWFAPQEGLREEITALDRPKTVGFLTPADDRRAVEHTGDRLRRNFFEPRQTLPPRLHPPAATLRLMLAMKSARLSWLELDDISFSARVHDGERFRITASAKHVACVVLPCGTEFRYALSAAKLALCKLSTMHRRGSHCAEIMFIIYGNRRSGELEKYRAGLISELQTYLDKPQGTFLASLILHEDIGASGRIGLCATSVRYDHWLEDHDIMQKLLWIVPGRHYEPVLRHQLWMSRRRVARRLQQLTPMPHSADTEVSGKSRAISHPSAYA